MADSFDDILDLSERVFVVAEIGKNFIQTEEDQSIGEYINNAKRLIVAAKAAGADAVKFQTHNVEDEQLNISISAPHFSGADRYAWVKRNTEATPLEFWRELKSYADSLHIMMFTTPMSRGAAKRIASLDWPLWKVSSGDMLDFVLLDYLRETKKLIIISTGMSILDEVEKAVAFLKEKTNQIIILHCASKYPAHPIELSLGMIPHLSDKFKVPIGFSDHTTEIYEAAKAVSMGACVIEKHLTRSRDDWGPDHKVSLTPGEFSEMVHAIRKKTRGDAVRPDRYHYMGSRELIRTKGVIPGEEVFLDVFRKSLVAADNIKAGQTITEDMLYAMRPQKYAGGLPSEEYKNVLNRKVTKDLKKYDPITKAVLNL